MPDSLVHVNYDIGTTKGEADALQSTFDDDGLSAKVSDQPYAITASGELVVAAPFVVVATVAASAFVKSFAAKAGEDSYEALKKFVSRLRAGRARDKGRIDIIIRGDDGPDIVIGPDLPEGALGRLLSEPLPPAPSGELTYDITREVWRDSVGK